ncbi:hypothetical protein [Nocardia carnea]|uniref:hypothetical protein n=1 Tax=Nocardia carnea TaxID=37328 RepID=UPI0024555BF1|nr:hypothetical protein [Nocardia carnea]
MPPAALLDAVVCDDCTRTVPPDQDTTLVDGDRLCPDCAAAAVYCDGCSEHTRAPRLTVSDTQLCRDCARTWLECGDCDRYSPYLTAIVGGGDVCDGCCDAYPTCDDCEDRCQGTTSVDGGNEVCAGCRMDDYHECADCCTLTPRAEDYCASCALDHPGHDEIRHYDYKPAPVFHGRGPLFLGLELELKTPGRQLFDAAEAALAELGDLGYLKHDSSIGSSGFELVTHPMDFTYARTEFPWTLLARLRLLGAYTDNEVGIHVHVSRAGFDSPAHIYRWMKFVYRNQDPVTVLARRDTTQWADFGTHTREQMAGYARGNRHGLRYEAINVQPENTFELRVFASSLHRQQVLAALAFADASVEYTRRLTAAQIARRRGWEWDAFTSWLHSRPQYAVLSAELEDLACAS